MENRNEPLKPAEWLIANGDKWLSDYEKMQKYADYIKSFQPANSPIDNSIVHLGENTTGNNSIIHFEVDNSVAFAEWMDIHTKRVAAGLYKLWLWGDNLNGPAKTQDGLFGISQLYQYFKDGKI